MQPSIQISIHKKVFGLMFTICCMTVTWQCPAQLNPFAALYYQNQYLGNPGMAGQEQGLVTSLAYRRHWTSVSGAPATQAFTIAYGTADRVGVGLNLYNDKAGVLQRTKAMGTFAYHLPLSEKQRISLGISFGVMNERIDNDEELIDPSVARFNDRGLSFEGDIGMAYRNGGFTFQCAVPNVMAMQREYEVPNLINQSSFFVAASYKTKLNLSGGAAPLGVEPKLCLRGISGYDDIIDIGLNFTCMDEQLNVTTLYHSTQSYTFGIGFKHMSWGIQAMYTTGTPDLEGQAGNALEAGMKLSLWNNKDPE